MHVTEGCRACLTPSSVGLALLAYTPSQAPQKELVLYYCCCLLMKHLLHHASPIPTSDVLLKASPSRLEFNWDYPYSVLNYCMKFLIKVCISLNSYF